MWIGSEVDTEENVSPACEVLCERLSVSPFFTTHETLRPRATSSHNDLNSFFFPLEAVSLRVAVSHGRHTL